MVWASSWLGIKVSSLLQTLMLGEACAAIPVLIPLYLNLFFSLLAFCKVQGMLSLQSGVCWQTCGLTKVCSGLGGNSYDCNRVDFQDNPPDLTSDLLLTFFLACLLLCLNLKLLKTVAEA